LRELRRRVAWIHARRQCPRRRSPTDSLEQVGPEIAVYNRAGTVDAEIRSKPAPRCSLHQHSASPDHQHQRESHAEKSDNHRRRVLRKRCSRRIRSQRKYIGLKCSPRPRIRKASPIIRKTGAVSQVCIAHPAPPTPPRAGTVDAVIRSKPAPRCSLHQHSASPCHQHQRESHAEKGDNHRRRVLRKRCSRPTVPTVRSDWTRMPAGDVYSERIVKNLPQPAPRCTPHQHKVSKRRRNRTALLPRPTIPSRPTSPAE
jgi:hypothetical protein